MRKHGDSNKTEDVHSFARGMNPPFWALILRVAQDVGQCRPSIRAETELNK